MRVRFVPDDAYLGTIADAITFRASDRSAGTAEGLGNASAGGGATAFSAGADSVSFNITPNIGATTVSQTFNNGNSTPGVASATDANGNYVLAWQAAGAQGYGVYAQRFNANGSPIDASPVLVSAAAAGSWEAFSPPSVVMDAAGDYMVAWGHFTYQWTPVAEGRVFNATTGQFSAIFDITPAGATVGGGVSLARAFERRSASRLAGEWLQLQRGNRRRELGAAVDAHVLDARFDRALVRSCRHAGERGRPERSVGVPVDLGRRASRVSRFQQRRAEYGHSAQWAHAAGTGQRQPGDRSATQWRLPGGLASRQRQRARPGHPGAKPSPKMARPFPPRSRSTRMPRMASPPWRSTPRATP